ncbi:Arf-GAP with SH3 domain, ANK repeat and PH domain-containing protein 1 [Anabarilius grahami]|uniref:Arf-GAP with SH3 domain, ANK repeat and PH domain-containing protein 1 n=1 Tax=Anabarilius grahami TaxID=495550 RepID=A0A3N0YFE9_ANAGA|nr:Arf-GAP with SH3 domain, ANK repeat and PH domain-containing protein 1 [Anabarilius grahami]
MPDQISVSEFLSETTEDYNSPTTSSFTTRLQSCRNTVNVLEEGLKNISDWSSGLSITAITFLVRDLRGLALWLVNHCHYLPCERCVRIGPLACQSLPLRSL